MNEVNLQPGDIVLFRSESILGRLVRFFTRSIGESRTKVDHSAIVISPGLIDKALIVDAWCTVKCHTIPSYYAKSSRVSVSIFRSVGLAEAEKIAIAHKAETYIGRTYGFVKLLAHMLDWFLLGIYFFRKLARSDRYPVCSWVVAYSYKAAGKDFGVPAYAASPDDIWDYVTSEGNGFVMIRELVPVCDPHRH